MVTQQQTGAMCQTVRMGVNCENTLSGRSQKRRAAHHRISFLWDIEKMNKSSGSEGITYCLPGTGKGEIQSIQQSRKVSLGLTRMFWNKKKNLRIVYF